jgi:hypothetical protein
LGVYPVPTTPTIMLHPRPRKFLLHQAYYDGLNPPLIFALLFLLFGFGIPVAFGLFSTLLPFLTSVGTSVFKVGRGVGFGAAEGPLPTIGTVNLSLSLLPEFERWKFPGWPVIGFSSIYSLPYFIVIFSVSARSWLLNCELVCVVVDDLLVWRESGSGVASLLAWLWPSAFLVGFVEGGIYVWPNAGVKSGSEAAKAANLFIP